MELTLIVITGSGFYKKEATLKERVYKLSICDTFGQQAKEMDTFRLNIPFKFCLKFKLSIKIKF